MDARRTSYLFSAVAIGAVALSACASNADTNSTPAPPLTSPLLAAVEVPPLPQLDPDRVKAGAEIYDQYCSSCHRPDLSGDDDWKKTNSDGSLRSPPHDDSGHTWHHSDQLLLTLIRDGSDLDESSMPAFGDMLTDDEIISVVEFFKSTWGTEARDFQWQVTWSEQKRSEG